MLFRTILVKTVMAESESDLIDTCGPAGDLLVLADQKVTNCQ